MRMLSTIRDNIIPHAVSWFTGEAAQDDDFQDLVDDDEGEDDDEDEDEEDKEDEEDDEEDDEDEEEDTKTKKKVSVSISFPNIWLLFAFNSHRCRCFELVLTFERNSQLNKRRILEMASKWIALPSASINKVMKGTSLWRLV